MGRTDAANVTQRGPFTTGGNFTKATLLCFAPSILPVWCCSSYAWMSSCCCVHMQSALAAALLATVAACQQPWLQEGWCDAGQFSLGVWHDALHACVTDHKQCRIAFHADSTHNTTARFKLVPCLQGAPFCLSQALQHRAELTRGLRDLWQEGKATAREYLSALCDAYSTPCSHLERELHLQNLTKKLTGEVVLLDGTRARLGEGTSGTVYRQHVAFRNGTSTSFTPIELAVKVRCFVLLGAAMLWLCLCS